MRPVKIQIRKAGSEDAALIADMSRRTFYDTFAKFNTRADMEQFLTVQFTEEQLIAEVGAERNTFLLAYIEDQPVGYARLFETKEPPKELTGSETIEISRLYCEKEAIGKGVGKALMEACLAVGREKNKDWIWLCVWEHNQRAIYFYEEFGFEKFGQHIFILGRDLQNDWAMKKKL